MQEMYKIVRCSIASCNQTDYLIVADSDAVIFNNLSSNQLASQLANQPANQLAH